MEKKMNYLWLFLLVVTVIALAVMFWAFSGPTTGSYSGGILIEVPELSAGQDGDMAEACAAVAEKCAAVREICAAEREACAAMAEACAAGEWR